MRVITPTYTTEFRFLKNYSLIAGVDEVGRGPLAGPVVSAVVILNPEKVGRYRSKTKWWQGVRDSKTLASHKRESLIDFIKQNAFDFAIGLATNEEIDKLNIHQASLLSMRRAVEGLKKIPELILIDGRFKIPKIEIPQKAIVKGDAQVLSIAAASILAKVFRDDLMKKFSKRFPVYGFEKHKGYDTALHRNRLIQYGACEIHRKSFVSLKRILEKKI